MFDLLSPWKPLLSALILPPVPLLLLILIGARLILPRRGLGFFIVIVSVALLWLSACQGAGRWLQDFVLHPPAALWSADIERLRQQDHEEPHTTAIVVLGGGMVPRAPEYGVSDLSRYSAERLRYAEYLSQTTGLPLAFSGGLGWGQRDEDAPSEAEIAQRVAQDIYHHPLRWTENASRDTRGNAVLTVRLLKDAGIRHIVLVTHAWHMPRALRDFRRAAGGDMDITAAPMGFFTRTERPELDWVPTSEGFEEVRFVLHELIGLAVGA
jgi:uncharacterized SAM-binding protein YcdF (DUF218 family)